MNAPNKIFHGIIMAQAIRMIKNRADSGIWNGKELDLYFMSCRWWFEEFDCMVIYTKENGYHSGGWWKNPEYERCYHLSISFPGGKNKKVLNKIIDGLFGNDKYKMWVEPPYSDIGKQKEVWHYRLFCDQFWQPIKPRGEVYNTHFTEAGWKSFSEIHK